MVVATLQALLRGRAANGTTFLGACRALKRAFAKAASLPCGTSLPTPSAVAGIYVCVGALFLADHLACWTLADTVLTGLTQDTLIVACSTVVDVAAGVDAKSTTECLATGGTATGAFVADLRAHTLVVAHTAVVGIGLDVNAFFAEATPGFVGGAAMSLTANLSGIATLSATSTVERIFLCIGTRAIATKLICGTGFATFSTMLGICFERDTGIGTTAKSSLESGAA